MNTGLATKIIPKRIFESVIEIFIQDLVNFFPMIDEYLKVSLDSIQIEQIFGVRYDQIVTISPIHFHCNDKNKQTNKENEYTDKWH